MNLWGLCLGGFGAAGLGGWLLQRRPGWSLGVGLGGAALASLLGLAGVSAFWGHGGKETLSLAWRWPFGSFALGMDALSAFFLVIVLGLTLVSALYGLAYFRPSAGKRNPGGIGFFFNLLAAGMVLLLLARNGWVFLIAWEVMSWAAFFLILHEHEKPQVRRAAWIYLMAAQLGAAFLLLFFAFLAQGAPSLGFEGLSASGLPVSTTVLFILAVVGFGSKAGILPFHVWLPEAHPAAPSPVSALLSGAMIKLGLYGLLRVLHFLGAPRLGWGIALMGIGLLTALAGVLWAMGQQELKRALAYSSVENVGIMVLGIGLGVTGMAARQPGLMVLGLAGSLLHMVNHAWLKGLWFLGAGTLLRATGEPNINRLGGLLKRLPWTGASLAVAAAGLAGIPVLNGFSGEFLLYLAALRGVLLPEPSLALSLLAGGVGLAMVGALAAVLFAGIFGIVFLGEPRTQAARQAREAAPGLVWPMVFLALLCMGMTFSAPWLVRALEPVVQAILPGSGSEINAWILTAGRSLGWVATGSLGVIGLAAALGLARWSGLRRRKAARGATWDCGYADPAPRMQYSAASFFGPVLDSFRIFILRRIRFSPLQGPFPGQGQWQSETGDALLQGFFEPCFRKLDQWLARARWLQHGRVQWYVLTLALTLALLLVWKLR